MHVALLKFILNVGLGNKQAVDFSTFLARSCTEVDRITDQFGSVVQKYFNQIF